jgi:cysteinyl-tRNA synthetase
MNITDVDDKIIRNAVARHQSLEDYTAVYTKAFLDDCDALRLERPEHLVSATSHIDDMVRAIERLSAGGHTYASDGSTYFRIASFPGYGKLSHNDFSGNIAGARVDVDEYEKADARDFALWKAPKEGEPMWETAIGPGRPGWHIECSVMAIKYLGETLDLHAGGVDLVFPHHENEIAQSESLTGQPFARFWLHAEFLMVEGQKMSKSLGNYFTLRDVLAKGYPPEAIRYLLASVPYRKQLNFTFDGLKSAIAAIERLRNFKLRLDTDSYPEGLSDAVASRTAAAIQAFRDSLNDDLNTAGALGAVFDYVRDANSAMDSGDFRSGNKAATNDLLNLFDSVFDVLRKTAVTAAGGSTVDGDSSGAAGAYLSDSAVESSIAERTAAKKARDFARADQIRDQLLEQGIVLEDTRSGVRWKRK